MKVFLAIFLLLMSSFISAQNTDKLTYLAEQINQYCRMISTTEENSGPPSNSNNVKMGKAGPPGGPGPPGIVDYNAIYEKMTEKLDGFKEGLLSKVSERLHFADRLEQGICRVKYNGHCFWLMSISKMNYESAELMCASLGAHPANIYSVNHYAVLLSYVQKTIPPDSVYVEPWLGMTYDTHRNVVMFSNGSVADYAISWHPGYPNGSAQRKNLNLSTRPDVNNVNQGIWNPDVKSNQEGVMCEV